MAMLYKFDRANDTKDALGQKPYEAYIPTVFIGLGGSGKEVLTRFRQRLFERHGVVRHEFLRFLYLDTNFENWSWCDEQRGLVPDNLRPDPSEYVDCKITPERFHQIFDALHADFGQSRMYQQWLKPEMENYGHAPLQHGAGTHRQFGRMAFVNNHEAIRRKLESQIDKAFNFAEMDPKNVLGENGGVEKNLLEVVIVGSVAGGTGAGMLIDTAYMVKHILEHQRYAKSTRYTSVFAFLPSALRDKVAASQYKKFQQNTYASLLELEYYGTPRTGDEIFLGPKTNKLKRGNQVAFYAPWLEGSADPLIRGPGWEACYLIDSVNSLVSHLGIPQHDLYQMLADYLFQDLERSAFGAKKRSARANLHEFREQRIYAAVRKEGAPSKYSQESKTKILEGEEILFETQSGCTFTSLGYGEITFDKPRLFRTAGYRLAKRLLERRWLGSTEPSTLDRYVDEDLFSGTATTGGISLKKEAMARTVYEYEERDAGGKLLRKNRMDDRDAALNTASQEPLQGGRNVLMELIRKELRQLGIDLWKSIPNEVKPVTLQTLEENRNRMTHVVGSDPGPLRKWIRERFRARCDEFGIVPARSLLEKYHAAISKQLNDMNKAWSGLGKIPNPPILSRLDEVKTLPGFARRLANSVEFKKAHDRTRGYLTEVYSKQASEKISEVYKSLLDYIGTAKEDSPHELVRIGRLIDYCSNSNATLNNVVSALEGAYERERKASDSFRKQLLPKSENPRASEWSDEKYDRLINSALVTSSTVGRAPTGDKAPFNWGRLQDRLLEMIRRSVKDADMQNAKTLPEFLDCMEQRQRKASANWTKEMAELLGDACRQILVETSPSLEEFGNGSAVDILVASSDSELAESIDRIHRYSVPYLVLDSSFNSVVDGYSATFHSLMGIKEGSASAHSVSNFQDIKQQLESKGEALSTNAALDGTIHSTLEGAETSIVISREVWGIPLQYMQNLNELSKAYRERNDENRSFDELHINYRETWEDLPDIRLLDASTYVAIRDNIDTVLFSMISGLITCQQDGVLRVQVRDRHQGYTPVRLGTKIHRAIKQACENPAVCNHMRNCRDEWKDEALQNLNLLVAAYCSAKLTYAEVNPEASIESKSSFPLRNCYSLLLEWFEMLLGQTDEGRRWLKYLRPVCVNQRETLNAEHIVQKYLEGLATDGGVLHRLSENLPIYAVERDQIGTLNLPTSSWSA